MSRATLDRKIASGEIKAIVTGGRTVILQSELDRYLSDAEVAA